MITRADIVAAREVAEGIPKEAALFNDPEKKAQAEKIAAQIQYMQTPVYIDKLAAQSFQGLAGEELEAARKKLATAEGKKMTDLFAQHQKLSGEAATGGMVDQYSGVAGGLGVAIGALLGGLFGGGKGALIGGILGGIGLYAAQKLGFGGESLQNFFKTSVDKVLGPAGIEIGADEKTTMIQTLTDNTQQAVANLEWGDTTTAEGIKSMSEKGLIPDTSSAPTVHPEKNHGDELYDKALTPPAATPVTAQPAQTAPTATPVVAPDVNEATSTAMDAQPDPLAAEKNTQLSKLLAEGAKARATAYGRQRNVRAGARERSIPQPVKNARDDLSRAVTTGKTVAEDIGNKSVDIATSPVQAVREGAGLAKDVYNAGKSQGKAGVTQGVDALKAILGGRPGN